MAPKESASPQRKSTWIPDSSATLVFLGAVGNHFLKRRAGRPGHRLPGPARVPGRRLPGQYRRWFLPSGAGCPPGKAGSPGDTVRAGRRWFPRLRPRLARWGFVHLWCGELECGAGCCLPSSGPCEAVRPTLPSWMAFSMPSMVLTPSSWAISMALLEPMPGDGHQGQDAVGEFGQQSFVSVHPAGEEILLRLFANCLADAGIFFRSTASRTACSRGKDS